METRIKKRIFMSIIGVVICGLSVGLFKRATLGVDPFQSLMSGLDALIPISFGTLYVIVCAGLLLFSIVMDRRKIGLATIINLFLVGYIADWSHQCMLKLFPTTNIVTRIGLLLAGIVIMCLASSFYFTADLGVSPYDALSLIISEKHTRIPFKVWRILSDLMCVILGVSFYLLSGNSLNGIGALIGAGTIVTAFFMGPLIDFFNRKIAQPFLG